MPKAFNLTSLIASYIYIYIHVHKAKRFPFGPPTLRLLLKIDVGTITVDVGTDASWMETEGELYVESCILIQTPKFIWRKLEIRNWKLWLSLYDMLFLVHGMT